MSTVVMSFGAIDFIKNRLKPNGGVMYAICMAIMKRTPNQIGSMPKEERIGM
mgnify:FL=1